MNEHNFIDSYLKYMLIVLATVVLLYLGQALTALTNLNGFSKFIQILRLPKSTKAVLTYLYTGKNQVI